MPIFLFLPEIIWCHFLEEKKWNIRLCGQQKRNLNEEKARYGCRVIINQLLTYYYPRKCTIQSIKKRKKNQLPLSLPLYISRQTQPNKTRSPKILSLFFPPSNFPAKIHRHFSRQPNTPFLSLQDEEIQPLRSLRRRRVGHRRLRLILHASLHSGTSSKP